MKYSTFERLVLVVSAVAVVATVIMSLLAGPVSWPELAGQVLVLVVLGSAVHWGRNGGFISAAAATIVYAALAVPQVTGGRGLQPHTVELVLVHAIVYAIVGVVGGEVCGRLKYQLATLSSVSALDDDTRLYAEPLVQSLVSTGLARFRRYGTPFSIVELTLSSQLLTPYRAVKRRSILRRVASHVRNDVRMVDDVGRLADGRFVALLASTPQAGADVVADRLQKGVRDLLDVQEEEVRARVLATDLDIDQCETFCESLQRAPGAVIDGVEQRMA